MRKPETLQPLCSHSLLSALKASAMSMCLSVFKGLEMIIGNLNKNTVPFLTVYYQNFTSRSLGEAETQTRGFAITFGFYCV